MNTSKREYLFPDRFLTREEAYEMVGGRRAFDDLAERFGVMPFPRFDGARATKYSLYDIQDAMNRYKEQVRGEVQYRAKGA